MSVSVIMECTVPCSPLGLLLYEYDTKTIITQRWQTLNSLLTGLDIVYIRSFQSSGRPIHYVQWGDAYSTM